MKKEIIVCKGWGWLWLTLSLVIFLAGIGYATLLWRGEDAFEKAFGGMIGIFMAVGGGFGILHNLFGEERTEEIGQWIYGIVMLLLCLAFFGTLIIGGIISLF